MYRIKEGNYRNEKVFSAYNLGNQVIILTEKHLFVIDTDTHYLRILFKIHPKNIILLLQKEDQCVISFYYLPPVGHLSDQQGFVVNCYNCDVNTMENMNSVYSSLKEQLVKNKNVFRLK